MDAIKYISGFSRGGAPVSDLSRIGSLLSALGSPQNRLRFVHIAGTNGKGSIAQMLSEVLVRQGFRTGLFTSPYILTFTDRIRCDNLNIPDEELEETVAAMRPAVEAHPLRQSFSQFEITQAAAFLWFEKKGCDVVVLEAGLGGLLDSTNIIPPPLVSVIGSIGLDHTAVLGSTIEQIAAQKAGIIKPGAPCVLSAGATDAVAGIFRRTAQEKNSRLVIPDADELTVRSCELSGSCFTYRGEEYRTAMPGQHQIRNALSVIEAARFISRTLPISRQALREGIAAARIFGRTEVLSAEPLVILDGGHNPDAMQALSQTLCLVKGRKIRAVIGMHSDKDARSASAALVPKVEEFYTVSGFSDRDIPSAQLAETIRSCGGRAVPADKPIPALIGELTAAHPEDVLLICGSLYLAAYVKNMAKPGDLAI